MTTPQTLPSIPGSHWHSQSGTWELAWGSTQGDYEIYELYVNGSISSNNGIKVNTNPSASDYNTWVDHGTSHPDNAPTENNGIVTLSSPGYANLYQFTKPTTASWISSGGGGGTGSEGLSYSGDLLFVPSVPDLVYTIPQSSAAGSYTIYSYDAGTSNLEETITHTTTGSVGTIGSVSNFDSSNTHKLFSPLGELLDTYSPGGVKKVHCNFW